MTQKDIEILKDKLSNTYKVLKPYMQVMIVKYDKENKVTIPAYTTIGLNLYYEHGDGTIDHEYPKYETNFNIYFDSIKQEDINRLLNGEFYKDYSIPTIEEENKIGICIVNSMSMFFTGVGLSKKEMNRMLKEI